MTARRVRGSIPAVDSPADVCVVGAGPAGCVLAARLAQLGHAVLLLEAAVFPRRQLGESLTPGVLPLLASAGLGAALEGPGVRPVRRIHVDWDRGPQVRDDPREEGRIVDRADFDHRLLELARGQGVRVLQPARAMSRRWNGRAWEIRVATASGTRVCRARFLADASGRQGPFRGRRRPMGRPTLAFHAYWEGRGLPGEPRMGGGREAWFWGVPLPDGTYHTLVFVDRAAARGGGAGRLEERFDGWLAESDLLAGAVPVRRVSPVRATEATPFLAAEVATARSIRVGDAAMALDPLSSSGVQKAIQSALSGALVVNTLLRRPESREAALAYHRSSLVAAADRHRSWAQEHYQAMAEARGGAFWTSRAAPAPPPASGPARSDPRLAAGPGIRGGGPARWVCSPDLEFTEVPCLGEEYVEWRTAVRHPSLDGPVAFVGGREIAPLLRRWSGALSAVDVAGWCEQHLPGGGWRLADWLVSKGLVIPAAAPARAI